MGKGWVCLGFFLKAVGISHYNSPPALLLGTSVGVCNYSREMEGRKVHLPASSLSAHVPPQPRTQLTHIKNWSLSLPTSNTLVSSAPALFSLFQKSGLKHKENKEGWQDPNGSPQPTSGQKAVWTCRNDTCICPGSHPPTFLFSYSQCGDLDTTTAAGGPWPLVMGPVSILPCQNKHCHCPWESEPRRRYHKWLFFKKILDNIHAHSVL